MVSVELQLIYDKLKSSYDAEDIFGVLEGSTEDKLSQGKKIYLMLVKQVHPDRYLSAEDKNFADLAFKELQKLWDIAQNRINSGKYGSKEPLLVISSKKAEYNVRSILREGCISTIYLADVSGSDEQVLIKVASGTDLLANEFKKLKIVREKELDDKTKFLNLIVEPYDTFTFLAPDKSMCSGNVFKYIKGLVSLEDVIKTFPDGIDERDMAWMFKRALAALWFSHHRGIVHGAPIPPHILLNLENHGIILVDWTQAATIGKEKVKFMEPDYIDYYPSAISKKEMAHPFMDIYILARTMIRLLGGDPKTNKIPANVSKDIRLILKSCTLENGWDDAWFIHQEFDTTIKKLFGPAKWRDFSLTKA